MVWKITSRPKFWELFKNTYLRNKIILYTKIFVFEISLIKTCSKIESKTKVHMQLAKDSDVLKIIRKFKRLNAIDRVKKGHLCFLATLHGDIVHYKWVAFNEFYVFGMKCRISPNSAYVYDAYTASEYRGLGISSKMTAKIFDYLRQKGTKKAFACVVYNNFPSLRVMQKLGYRKMGEITIIRILSKLWIKKYQGETQEDYYKLREMF